LQGHWWPHRHRLKIKGRRKKKQPSSFPAKLKVNGRNHPVELPGADYPIQMIPSFGPPGRLIGGIAAQIPIAAEMFLRMTAPLPKMTAVAPSLSYEQPTVEYPVNLDITDVVRFLAKVAHGYAIFHRGRNAFSEFFLQDIILGRDTTLANNFVGNTPLLFEDGRLPGTTLHALMSHTRGDELSVLVQLFREAGDPPPIYEVVVGKLA